MLSCRACCVRTFTRDCSTDIPPTRIRSFELALARTLVRVYRTHASLVRTALVRSPDSIGATPCRSSTREQGRKIHRVRQISALLTALCFGGITENYILILTTNIVSNWSICYSAKYNAVFLKINFDKFISYFEWHFFSSHNKICLFPSYLYIRENGKYRKELKYPLLISILLWYLLNHLPYILYAQLL